MYEDTQGFYSRYRKHILAAVIAVVLVTMLSISGLVNAAIAEVISVLYTPSEPENPVIEVSFTNRDTIVELFGDVSNLGKSTITERGFVWSLSSHEAPGNIAPGDTDYECFWIEEGIFGSEQFSHLPQDLLSDTDYYGRGFIVVEGEYIYSEDELVFDPESAAPTPMSDIPKHLIPTVLGVFGIAVAFTLKQSPITSVVVLLITVFGMMTVAQLVF